MHNNEKLYKQYTIFPNIIPLFSIVYGVWRTQGFWCSTKLSTPKKYAGDMAFARIALRHNVI